MLLFVPLICAPYMCPLCVPLYVTELGDLQEKELAQDPAVLLALQEVCVCVCVCVCVSLFI